MLLVFPCKAGGTLSWVFTRALRSWIRRAITLHVAARVTDWLRYSLDTLHRATLAFASSLVEGRPLAGPCSGVGWGTVADLQSGVTSGTVPNRASSSHATLLPGLPSRKSGGLVSGPGS